MTSLPYPTLCPVNLIDTEKESKLGSESRFDPILYGKIDLDGSPDTASRNFTFSITFQNNQIARYILDGKAKMSLIIEAKTSLVRKSFQIDLTNEKIELGTFTIDPINLDEWGIALPAEATIYIVSVSEILDYILPGAPSIMGRNDGVTLPKGAILGYSLVLPLLPRLEESSSIIEPKLNEKLEPQDSPKISYTGSDKIYIELDSRSYAMFASLKDDSATGPALTYSLVMPALIQAVSVVMSQKNQESDESISLLAWYQSLEVMIKALKDDGLISDQSHAYEVAHLIMKKHLNLADAISKIPISHSENE